MTLVWRSAPYQGNTLLALLALADWSDDKGVSWPAVETLARKSRQSDRNIQRVLHSLRRDGFLKIAERKGTSSKYTINIHRLEGCHGVTPAKSSKASDKVSENSDRMSPYTSLEPSLDSYTGKLRDFVFKFVEMMIHQQRVRHEVVGVNAQVLAAHLSKEKQTVVPVSLVEEAIEAAVA